VEERCLEFKLEYRVFEIVFFSLILFITSVEVASALHFLIHPSKPFLKADSREEAVLTALSPLIAYLAHCLSKALSVKALSGTPSFKIVWVKILPVISFFDSSSKRRNPRSFFAKTLGLDIIAALVFLALSLFLPSYDLPLTLTFALYTSSLSRRLYLLLVALFLSPSLRVIDSIDHAFFYGPCEEAEIGGSSIEMFIRLWMVWSIIMFVATWLSFLMIEAGAMIYGLSFTLKIGFLEIFSVERLDGLFKTKFNPINAFIFSVIISLAPAFIETKLRE